MIRNVIRKHFSEDGWALSEMLGSSLFYLVMLGIAAGFLIYLFANAKLSQMEQGLTSMSMEIQGLYAGSASYAGLDNAVALRAGVVPKKFVRGSRIESPWGGNISIVAGSDAGTYRIRVEGIEQADCTKLAIYQMETWERVEVNGSLISGAQRVSDAARSCGARNNVLTYTGR